MDICAQIYKRYSTTPNMHVCDIVENNKIIHTRKRSLLLLVHGHTINYSVTLQIHGCVCDKQYLGYRILVIFLALSLNGVVGGLFVLCVSECVEILSPQVFSSSFPYLRSLHASVIPG